jgi:uncharacterized membrane protein
MRFVFVLAALIAVASPARAGFSVCNNSALPTKVAMARFDGTRWSSHGWWEIAPQKCAELISGKLDARYYYLYATDGATGTWEGSKTFCVGTTDKFAIVGRSGCETQGFDHRGFFEVDTGNQFDWTQMLSD